MMPPTSGRKAVRLRNASIITGISEIYAFLMSTWIGTQTYQKKTRTAPATWSVDFRAKLLALADQIQSVKQMTELAKWEGSIRGKWPAEEYEKLVLAESEMISGLAQVRVPYLHTNFTYRCHTSLEALLVTYRIVGGLLSCIQLMSSTQILCVCFSSTSMLINKP